MTLQPYEYFTLFIQLDDHTDSSRDSYYVRSVIRNARTSELLASVNLDSKGDGEYSKPWQVPADPSGLGLWIKVVTTVYSDSGYTTKVANYGQEGDVFLIDERVKTIGGGSSFNYDKIQKMIDASLSKIDLPEYEAQTLDLNPVLEEISKLYKALIELPRYKDSAQELTSLREAISAIYPMIKALDKPEKEIDLSPITEKLNELSNMVGSVETSQAAKLTSVEDTFQAGKDEIIESLDEIKNVRMNFQIVSKPKDDVSQSAEVEKKKLTRARY